MSQDAAVPPGFEPTPTTVERRGVLYSASRWSPETLVALAQRLRTVGRRSLLAIPDQELLIAWSETVAVFLDRTSPERRALDPMLTRLCQLSQGGLEAALGVVLGGVDAEATADLLSAAKQRPLPEASEPLVLVVLAANLPALAVQPLLPALLLRLPVVLKSPSSEPLFAPAFVRSLSTRLPELASCLAAVSWKGGDRSLEDPLLTQSTRVLAYGDEPSLADLRQRAGDRLFEYGPKTSLAIVATDDDLTGIAAGLARDIALFDQRGCLSIQAVFTTGDAVRLARAIANELQVLYEIWPPGPIDPVAAAGVQQLRSEAAMRGLTVAATPLAVGTVIVEPEPVFQPTPGMRTIRVHPLKTLAPVAEILTPWDGRLQGAALAGDEAWRLRPVLRALGVSRYTSPGELQRADAGWHNGGVHPLDILTGVGEVVRPEGLRTPD